MSNASFKKVSNFTGTHSDLNVSDLKVDSLSVNEVAYQGVGNYTRRTVVGYLPTAATAIGDHSITVNPGETTATTTNTVTLPVGALIESAQITGTGLVGTVSLGLDTINTAGAAPAIMTSATAATVNGVGALALMADATQNTAVNRLLGLSLPAVTTDNVYVNFSNAGAESAAAVASVRVAITYLTR